MRSFWKLEKMLKFTLLLIASAGLVNGAANRVPGRDGEVELDTSEDLAGTLWSIDCRYASKFEDFWVLGCDLQPSANSNSGYWTPCDTQTCTITWNKNNAESIWGSPNGITTYLATKGSGSFEISTQSSGDGPRIVHKRITAQNGQWSSTSTPLQGLTSTSSVIVTLHGQTSADFAILDSAIISFGEGSTSPTTVTPRPTTPEGECPEVPECACHCYCNKEQEQPHSFMAPFLKH